MKVMILQKEFYFVRHGQTDHNVLEGENKSNYLLDISLNEIGRNQARLIEPIISALPIKTICSSPLKRAKETRDIISVSIRVPSVEINDLGECSAHIWNEMVRFGMHTSFPKEEVVQQYMERVQNGINTVLSLEGPSLLVSHGGVHWALCYLMGIHGHKWIIDNCVPVRFSRGNNEKWTARKLI